MSSAQAAEQTGLESALVPLARKTAAALRAGDRAALVASLNVAIRLLPMMRRAWLELNASRVGPAVDFPAETLTLPLRSSDGILGVLQQRVGDCPSVGSGHLQLLAAMAELAGAVIDRARPDQDRTAMRAMVSFVLEQIPVGAVFFGADQEQLGINTAAASLLGPAGDAALLSPVVEAGAGASLIAIGPRAVLAHVHVHKGARDRSPAVLVLVADLSDKIAAFASSVAQEVYRALWLREPLTLVALAAPGAIAKLIDAAGSVAASLPPDSVCGPLSEAAFGLVVRQPADEVRHALRSPARFGPEIRLGLVELAATERPEGFIRRAAAALEPAGELLRPVVLVYDVSPSVTESLRVALCGESEVVVCHDRVTAGALISSRPFDAMFANIEPDDEEADTGLVRRAIALQPRLAPILITALPGPYQHELEGLPPGTLVFRKPFVVRAVRSAVRTLFGERGNAGP